MRHRTTGAATWHTHASLREMRVEADPFPHAVVDDLLPPSVADELRERFPPAHSFAPWRPKGSNQKLYRDATRLLADRRLAEIWREFLLATPALAWQVLDAFAPWVRGEHPSFESRFGQIEQLRRVELREDALPPRGAVGLDSRLILHTPVTERPSAERAPHVKNLHAIVFGYFDLVAAEDTGAGGDYVLYRPREGARIEFTGRRQEVDPDLLEEARRISRRHNRLVLFANGPRSIQWISTRDVTPLPTFAHLTTLRLGEPVFDLPFAPGAGPTPFGAGFSARRTLAVLAENVRRLARRRFGSGPR